MCSVSVKKGQNEYIQLSVTLFATALVVAILLALVNYFTAPQIALFKQQRLEQAMLTVMPDAKSFDDITDSVSVHWTNDTPLLSVLCAKDVKGNVIGYSIEVAPKGYSDEIDMMVGLNVRGEIVNTGIISHSDTPGIGAKIEEKSYLQQFVGKKGVLSTVKKSATAANEVELISGATYSSLGFSKGVNAAMEAYQIITEEGIK